MCPYSISSITTQESQGTYFNLGTYLERKDNELLHVMNLNYLFGIKKIMIFLLEDKTFLKAFG